MHLRDGRCGSGSGRAGFAAGVGALLALAGGCSSMESGGETPGGPPAAAAAHARDSVIVRFRTPPTASSLRAVAAAVNGAIDDADDDGRDDRFAHIADGELAVVRLAAGADVETAVAELGRDPDVRYAEPNYLVEAVATPDDPRFPELYGLDNTGQTGGTPGADIDAVAAWDRQTGDPNIVVAVIDTGIDTNHEDLAANLWVNPGETPGNGVDDDGNGVIDDVHGFDAIRRDGNPFDDHFHGTHCAGTIGAVGDNGIGVAGVNWRTQIMAIKFLDETGGGPSTMPSPPSTTPLRSGTPGSTCASCRTAGAGAASARPCSTRSRRPATSISCSSRRTGTSGPATTTTRSTRPASTPPTWSRWQPPTRTTSSLSSRTSDRRRSTSARPGATSCRPCRATNTAC